FNTVNIGRLTNAMLFVMIALMIIGAGPCSTGGGFKVTTFMTLVLQAWSSFRGFSRVNCFRRTIPKVAIERAYVTAMTYFVVAGLGLTLLLMYEQSDRLKPGKQDHFLCAAFEVVSALGTVGLSTGITSNLTVPGKLIIIGLMFLGRVGPISAFAALSRRTQRELVEYSNEEPLLG
ncbi:MAG TPA: potassium transporter TrkG, partial [Pirellulaceae bacterium]